MKKIPLGNLPEKYTLVDDNDYKFLSKFKWHVDRKIYVVNSKLVEKYGMISNRMSRVIMNPPKHLCVDHIME